MSASSSELLRPGAFGGVLQDPRDVLTICVGKSTYARCGIIVNVTPFEPEWEGFVTLEISNTTPLPARIYANEGLCQILFFQSDEICETSYKDRKGKYQDRKASCCRSCEVFDGIGAIILVMPPPNDASVLGSEVYIRASDDGALSLPDKLLELFVQAREQYAWPRSVTTGES